MRLDEYAQKKKLPKDFLKSLGVEEDQGLLKIPYYEYEKTWKENKPTFNRLRKNDRVWIDPPGSSLILYGLWRKENYDATNLYALLCEGEPDTQTAWHAGYTAFGLPGAGSFKEEWAPRLFSFERLFLCFDNDDAGERGCKKTIQELKRAGYPGTIHILKLPDDYNDLNELFVEKHNGDKQALTTELKQLIGEAQKNPVSDFSSDPIDDIWEEKEDQDDGNKNKSLFTPLKDFLAQDTEPIEWLVEGLIPKGWNILLAGNSKVGKTLISLDLAKSIATGKDFLGRKTTAGPVALVLLDDPPSLIRKRLDDYGFDSDNVHISTARFREDNFFEQLEEDLKVIKPSFVLIDTLIKIVPRYMGSENDATVMDELAERFYRVAERCGYPTFLFIHHVNKSGGVRGSTAIEGATPMVILTVREGEDVKVEIQWKLEPIDPFYITFDSENSTFKQLGSVEEVKTQQIEDEAYNYLLEAGEDTGNGVAKAIGRRAEQVYRMFKESDRFKFREDKSGQGRPRKLYSINSSSESGSTAYGFSSQSKDPSGNEIESDVEAARELSPDIPFKEI